MNEQDVDILLLQIKNIILNKAVTKDLQSDSDDLVDLQEAIYYLSNCLSESNEFLKNISMGNLDAKTPSRYNFLAGSLKELHSGLRYLTWQANQVANGDYKQKAGFLGDFSDSFNKMVAQLAERENKLRNQNNALMRSRNLLVAIMDGLPDWIIVTEKETGEILYTNQSASVLRDSSISDKHSCGDNCRLIKKLREYKTSDEELQFECTCLIHRKILHAKSFFIQWDGKQAYAHVVADVTCERDEKEHLENMAFKDELTEVYNRRYCMKQLDRLIKDKKSFSVCMIDLDRLKQVNDTFGHQAGDEYIKTVSSEMIKTISCTNNICRVGGDEFIVILDNCSEKVAREKLADLENKIKSFKRAYPMSISYGIIYVSSSTPLLTETILQQIDASMYEFKNNKRKMS